MKKTRLVLVIVGGLALPLSAAAEGVPTAPLPDPLYDITPIEHVYQQQQMETRAMRMGAQGSAGVSMFDRLDTSGDGYLNAAEAEKSDTAKRDFNVLDKDGSGWISREEWKAGGGQ